ncbi:hypothetical protein MKW92_002918 [Papaver armeniacum]|nr:hypothetical protein MKW92_002918 [Papaver armeniacum]
MWEFIPLRCYRKHFASSNDDDHIHDYQLLYFLSSSAADLVQTKPGCQPKCGNISIPYPFGIGEDCSLDSTIYGIGFNVECNTSSDYQQKPLLHMSKFTDFGDEIFSISDTEIRVGSSMAENCIYKSPFLAQIGSQFFASSEQTPFTVSQTKNKVFAVGCNTSSHAIISMYGGREDFRGGCFSQCETWDKVIEGSCSGSGCCQTTIPKGAHYMFGFVRSNQSEVWPFNRCSYAFVAETDRFKFSAADLVDIHRKDRDDITMVLDWAIGKETCIEAQKNTSTYVCQGNSYCKDPVNNPGYQCFCNEGYEGNPYLKPGCQDINECKDEHINRCTNICTNTIGSYNCSCPDGISGDGRKDGSGCIFPKREFPIFGVTLGTYLFFNNNLPI